MQENGALATRNIFRATAIPSADSHMDLPVISADRKRLEYLELVPFRAAIAAGVDSVMTGHLSIPALEPDPNTPATFSSNILTGVLRKELGYQGLVVTDAMDMGGITVRFAPGEAAVRAFAAGADALLMPPVPDAAFEALQEAVKSGRISRETAGCVGATHLAGESAAGSLQTAPGGRERAEQEIRQSGMAESSAGNFGSGHHAVAGHGASVAPRWNKADAGAARLVVRRS